MRAFPHLQPLLESLDKVIGIRRKAVDSDDNFARPINIAIHTQAVRTMIRKTRQGIRAPNSQREDLLSVPSLDTIPLALSSIT